MQLQTRIVANLRENLASRTAACQPPLPGSAEHREQPLPTARRCAPHGPAAHWTRTLRDARSAGSTPSRWRAAPAPPDTPPRLAREPRGAFRHNASGVSGDRESTA
ncbi:hypothetical protein GCM10027174_39600 [Salinifilum aidingensis]